MLNWDNEIENLKKLVFEDNLSYSEIGRIYNCSGSNIKKVMLRRGIQLPVRSSNLGSSKQLHFCLNCGKDITSARNTFHKYCSNKCQHEYEYKCWVEQYQVDNSIAKSTKWGQLPSSLRRYIFNKFNNRCCKCGWSEINPYTQTLPLEIDHINGNYEDNSEDNLQLLCPNCHALTSTYRGANRGHGRNITWSIKSPQLETIDEESCKFDE